MARINPCALCKSISYSPVFRDERLAVVRCLRCGLVQQEDYEGAISKLSKHPEKEYYSDVNRAKVPVNPLKQLRTRDIQQRIVQEFKPQGALLDVGCGNGEFLEAIQSSGIRVAGVEPNNIQASCARENYGVEVVTSMYTKALFSPESFDVITFIQVLEHVADPLETLEIAFFHLRPGGYVIIDVPGYHNPRILLFRALKWNRLVKRDFIPTHNFYYTRDTLSEIANRCGFTVLEAVTGRYKVKHGYRNKLFKSVLGPIDFVANLLGIGGITLYAQKAETTLIKHSKEAIQA